MNTHAQPFAPAHSSPPCSPQSGYKCRWHVALRFIPLVIAAFLLAGCGTPRNTLVGDEQLPFGNLRFTEGDVLKITFPGAPDLNVEQKIRLDGMIALNMVGEVKAAGLTPTELEKEILRRYGPQLETKQVTVTFSASTFPVFVTGAVVKPGKIITDRPLTLLEAIMEAGGFTPAARKHHVVVIRNGGKDHKSYVFDLGPLLNGKSQAPFYLQQSDVVYVPESTL